MSDKINLTQLLNQANSGDTSAYEKALPQIYQDLKKIARSYMKNEAKHHTLQPTALVHEAYLKLSKQENFIWQNRSHFLAISANIMRRVLVDHARAKKAEKRGGDWQKATLEDVADVSNEGVDLLALDQALTDLAQQNERQAQIVELRYFSGLSIDETSTILKISTATVKRDWNFAKVWLFKALSEEA